MARLHDCLADIDTWMTLNRLKLNKEKTELLVLHSRHRSPPAFASLKIGSEVILPSHSARKLQYVQNAAARLITGIRKHDHITPILMDLHWLPVNERIQFKILLLTFKSLNGFAPVYIDEMIYNLRTLMLILRA